MPKGKKRTNAEYEKEIEDAVKRFKKYPEHRRAARNSDDWQDFLMSIGISPSNIEAGSNFWEQVREKTVLKYPPEFKSSKDGISTPEIISEPIRKHENRIIYLETTKSGSQYKEIYNNRKGETYRDIKTGRFTKKNG